MTNKEAIKIIQEDALYNPEAAKLSIQALKKDIAETPVVKDGKRYCPVCGSLIKGSNYCSYCGQRTTFIMPTIKVVDAGRSLDVSECIDMSKLKVYELKDDGGLGREYHYSENVTNPDKYNIEGTTLLLPTVDGVNRYIVGYDKFAEGEWTIVMPHSYKAWRDK